jgi:hypothetical protein
MGWTTCIGYDKERLLRDRLRDKSNGTTEWKVIAHSLRGNNLWYVVERTDHGDGYKKVYRYIALDLIGYDPHSKGWGYKDLCETMGPAEKNCPLKFLDMVPVPCDYGYGHQWREEVRAWHNMSRDQRKKLKEINPQPGEKWLLRDGLVDRATRKEKLHTAWINKVVGRDIYILANDGNDYRVRKSHLVRIMGNKEVATLGEFLS